MRRLTASAPGKLVLSGEYAVLDGAPAIAAAVDRRAVVRIADSGRQVVTTAGFDDASRDYSLSNREVQWARGAAPIPLFELLWNRLAQGRAGCPEVHLDTTAFSADGRKLGLGSSAALAVALAGALRAWLSDDFDIAGKATALHREFQGGRGSGVDIATSVCGGLLEFRMGEAALPFGWPPGLGAAVMWSGVTASTRERLQKLETARRHGSRRALSRAAEEAAGAWRRGVAADVMAATADYTAALKAFSDEHALDIFTAGHGAMVELAETEGLVYKPCGAGGGDVGLLLGIDAGRIDAVARLAAGLGFERLHVATGFRDDAIEGLTLEWMHD